VAYNTGKIKIWSLKDAESNDLLAENIKDTVLCMEYVAAGGKLYVGTDKGVLIWNVETKVWDQEVKQGDYFVKGVSSLGVCLDETTIFCLLG